MKKLVPDSFMKIKIDHIFGLTVLNAIQFVFVVCPSGRLPNIY